MNSKIMVIANAFLAATLIGTIGIITINNVSATITNTGATDGQNSCGNDKLSLNIFCQNVSSEVQGSDNAVLVNATQPE